MSVQPSVRLSVCLSVISCVCFLAYHLTLCVSQRLNVFSCCLFVIVIVDVAGNVYVVVVVVAILVAAVKFLILYAWLHASEFSCSFPAVSCLWGQLV